MHYCTHEWEKNDFEAWVLVPDDAGWSVSETADLQGFSTKKWSLHKMLWEKKVWQRVYRKNDADERGQRRMARLV